MCQESTDFHFPDLEKQFERIEAELAHAHEWRTLQQRLAAAAAAEEEGADRVSVKSSGSSSSEVRAHPPLAGLLWERERVKRGSGGKVIGLRRAKIWNRIHAANFKV